MNFYLLICIVNFSENEYTNEYEYKSLGNRLVSVSIDLTTTLKAMLSVRNSLQIEGLSCSYLHLVNILLNASDGSLLRGGRAYD